MTQNRSTAVMQRRHVEIGDGLDYYPTPPWATRALCRYVLEPGVISEHTVWEPACGEGYMARTLEEYFRSVVATDIADYGGQDGIHDFLGQADPPECVTYVPPRWMITNPPFKWADGFVFRALDMGMNVAVLVRTAFLEGKKRHAELFTKYPPTTIAQFTERVPMVKGRLDRSAASATAYCWIVWDRDEPGDTRFQWIPPCRKALDRPEDYPDDGQLQMFEVA